MEESSTSAPAPRGYRWSVFAIVLAVTVIVVDQVTKQWALASLNFGEPVEVIDGILVWVLKLNSGAAFSFLSGATWLFTIISSVVALVIVWYLRHVQAPIWGVIAGLVLGGALGNLFDRFFRDPGFAVGHVVDYIYTPWMMPAVYNAADIAVVTGMGLFLTCTVLGVSLDGTRTRKRHDHAPHGGSDSHPDAGV